MKTQLSKILYSITVMWTLLSCQGGIRSDQGVILFSVVGNAPFSDSVSTLNVDGSRYRPLLSPTLSPTATESYMYASGYSTKGSLLVVAHKLVSDKTEDYLFVYSPLDQKRLAIQTAEGSVGRGAFSPDHSSVVFAFAPGRATYYKLYIKKPQNGQPARLTNARGDDNETEGYASWRPDSQEITFVELRVSSGRVVSRLLRVPTTGGEPSVILEEDSPGGAVYSPSGRTLYVLTKRGIEEMETDGTNRRLILDWNHLPYAGFRYGCISLCTGSDLIVFAITNKKKESEIWTVSLNGQNAKKIHTVRDGSIEGLFFLTPAAQKLAN
jgi:hypothetical protein